MAEMFSQYSANSQDQAVASLLFAQPASGTWFSVTATGEVSEVLSGSASLGALSGESVGFFLSVEEGLSMASIFINVASLSGLSFQVDTDPPDADLSAADEAPSGVEAVAVPKSFKGNDPPAHEPAAFALLGAGLASLGLFKRIKRN